MPQLGWAWARVAAAPASSRSVAGPQSRLRRRSAVDSVAKNVSESWWQYLVLGIVSVIFGIVALVWPGKTLATVIVIFGLFAPVMGIITCISPLPPLSRARPL